MNLENQRTYRDCFPTCFANAMHYFDIPVVPAIVQRLEVFNNGTENCTIYSSEERLEHYERSIHKFIAEWNWACNYKVGENPDAFYPEAWTTYLLKMGVHLEFKNGPIEQKELIMNALSNASLTLCEVLSPSTSIPDSEARHFVLIVKRHDNRLFIHDPLPIHHDISSEWLVHRVDTCGSNQEIDCDYFFSNKAGPLKPKPNRYQTDWGYKFILISRQVEKPE